MPIFVPTRGTPPEPPSDLVRYVPDVVTAVREATVVAGGRDVNVAWRRSCAVAAERGPARRVGDPVDPGRARQRRRLFGEERIELEPTRALHAPGVTRLRYRPSAPYQHTVGAFAKVVRAASVHEETNTRHVAHVVRDLAGRDDAPTRLLNGTDAVPLAQQAAQELAASDEAWREVSLSVLDRNSSRSEGSVRRHLQQRGHPS